MNNVTQYWEKSIDFDRYISDNEQIITRKEERYADKITYYDLNLKRMQRLLKTYQPPVEQIERLKALQFEGKILIITEGWCGDAAQIVPVVQAFFSPTNEVRLVYRDENLPLMEQYLTNGAQSIPIVLLLNKQNEVLAHWGPRPKFGDALLKRFKENPTDYPKEQFLQDVQMAYNKNKGVDIINEILDLL